MNKKQPSTRNYSFIALIFALLACIATFFLAIIAGLAQMGSLSIWDAETARRYLLIGAGLVILGLAVYMIMEPDRVRRFFTGRQARYGSNAIVMSIAFIGILIVGNVLAFQNPKQIWDLTEDDSNTLSPELLAAFEGLSEDVHATAFFSQMSNTTAADELLSKIKANSDGKFDYEFVDPDRDPQAAIAAGITGDGKILLKMGDQQEIVAYASETEILKGMLRLLNPGNTVIYFLTGHGERDTENAGDASMTRAKETLETKNYAVKALNLIAVNKIPEDASAVVIAGPLKPVSDNEVKLLKDYLASGGSVIVMQDPTPLTEFGDASDPLTKMLSIDWGITFDNDIVIDLNSPQPTTAAAQYYDPAHAITRNMNTLVTYFPFSQSLKVAETMEGVALNHLVRTGENSWGEKDFESLTQQNGGTPSFDESTEPIGPLTLVAAAENNTTTGRVVVFGSSNFAIDPNFDAYGNGDMFVNSVDWAAEQEELANITPKTPIERSFNTPAPWQGIVILLGSIFLIPGLVVLAGISTWISRKRQG
jgi:ABC-type uncharacterized transport system involved in gliding motility auxiliary subunit